MASSEGNTPTYKMVSCKSPLHTQPGGSFTKPFSILSLISVFFFQTSLDPDINQHFQDAIDVIQQHSHNAYYDPGTSCYKTCQKHVRQRQFLILFLFRL